MPLTTVPYCRLMHLNSEIQLMAYRKILNILSCDVDFSVTIPQLMAYGLKGYIPLRLKPEVITFGTIVFPKID